MEDLEKLPVDTKMSRPEAGAYGEKAELDGLKKALPSSAPGPSGPPQPGGGGSPASVRPTPTAPGPGGATLDSKGTPGGIPPLLARPTEYPNRPVSTPMGGNPMQAPPAAVNAQQQRLATLDAIARSPEVSDEMKEWASAVREAIIGG